MSVRLRAARVIVAEPADRAGPGDAADATDARRVGKRNRECDGG